jgi:hypothetical protein
MAMVLAVVIIIVLIVISTATQQAEEARERMKEKGLTNIAPCIDKLEYNDSGREVTCIIHKCGFSKTIDCDWELEE